MKGCHDLFGLAVAVAVAGLAGLAGLVRTRAKRGSAKLRDPRRRCRSGSRGRQSARRQVAQLLAHGVLTVDRANLVQSKANERKQIPGLLETCGVCDYCRKGGKSKGWCRVRKVAQDYRMRYNERLDFANVRMCQEPPRRRVTGSI